MIQFWLGIVALFLGVAASSTRFNRFAFWFYLLSVLLFFKLVQV